MSSTGFYEDAPFKITNEGRTITITLNRIDDNSAEITWTLPFNNSNCSAPPREYNGIVIVLDNVPIKIPQSPVNGQVYVSDATANRTQFAGDTISSGLVVGAFYNDKTTVSMVVTGLVPNVPYYVAGFAVDNVNRYHIEGVHTYSLPYDDNYSTNSTQGYQIVSIGTELTHSTGLLTTNTYNLNIAINTNPTQTFQVVGAQAQTYQDLINQLNNLFVMSISPIVSVSVPNLNAYYVDIPDSILYQWDGSKNNQLANVLFNSYTPTTPPTNSYWLNTTNPTFEVLSIWNGTTYNELSYSSTTHSLDKLTCGDIWFDGMFGYKWDGTIWKEYPTYITASDPSTSILASCGTYWFNTTTNTLEQWQMTPFTCALPAGSPVGTWNLVASPIKSQVDPNAFASGAFWFDTTNTALNQYAAGSGWSALFLNIVVTLPPAATSGTAYWYATSTPNIIYQYNLTTGHWDTINGIVYYPTDPTLRSQGDLWWDTANNTLHEWSIVSSSWAQVSNFIIGTIDPSIPVPPIVNAFWFYNNILQCWDGSKWNVVNYFNYAQEPILVPGNVWFNTTNNTWNTWDGTSWVQFVPISCTFNPATSTPPGEFWFNTANNTLNMYTGVAWLSLPFSSSPLTPVVGTNWYNPTTGVLSSWDAHVGWTAIEPPVWVTFTTTGDLQFHSSLWGSYSQISITADVNPTLDVWLGISKIMSSYIQPPVNGSDGVSSTPMYNQLGVGTDGTDDERRDIIEIMLSKLGHPVVQVELTKEMLNICVDRSLANLRRLCSAGYEQAFFFLQLVPGQQFYVLSDISSEFNKVVDVMMISRQSNAFMSTAGGAGVYGQMVLQHLYSMGTYDVASYHILSEYSKTMQRVFATNIQFSWHEKNRTLLVMQNVWANEIVVVECVIEKLEQDIMSDRHTKDWCINWALAEACLTLAEIRGKFSSVPSAGGGISLNAADLKTRATELFQQCRDEIDHGIVAGMNEFGGASQISWG